MVNQPFFNHHHDPLEAYQSLIDRMRYTPGEVSGPGHPDQTHSTHAMLTLKGYLGAMSQNQKHQDQEVITDGSPSTTIAEQRCSPRSPEDRTPT